MTKIPLPLRAELAGDPFYKLCARKEALHDHECQPDPLTGKLIEWEHALIFASKQVQERYAIVPLCWYVHRGPGAIKEINEWIALNRASMYEILEISRVVDQSRKRDFLNRRYGGYPGENLFTTSGEPVHINYGFPQGSPEF